MTPELAARTYALPASDPVRAKLESPFFGRLLPRGCTTLWPIVSASSCPTSVAGPPASRAHVWGVEGRSGRGFGHGLTMVARVP